jgi:anti-anti-sigma factor
MLDNSMATSFKAEPIDENTFLVSVAGDLDLSSSPAFRRILEASGEIGGQLIVSLEGCNYCDSSGLVQLIRTAKQLGSRLRIVVAEKSPLNRLFNLAGVDLPIVRTLETAVLPLRPVVPTEL